MPVSAVSTPNIALIKYWGNRNDDLRLPMADSLSITLDKPSAEVTVEAADAFFIQTFDDQGEERPLPEKEQVRWRHQFELAKNYLAKLDLQEGLPPNIHVIVRSHVPPRIGFASSAAVFSAAAEAYAGLIKENSRELTRQETSVIARFGAGSAARSVMGGFVAIDAGVGTDIDAAHARQIADEKHWKLFDVVIIPSHDEKKVGSTEGHALAHTSPLFPDRIKAIPRRQKECIDAILTKDFEKLQYVSEEDAFDMHAVMRSQTPSLDYLSGETHRILSEISDLRKKEHLEVLYTMDAGPTVHLICTEAALPRIRAYAKEQKGYTIFEAGVGGGSQVISKGAG